MLFVEKQGRTRASAIDRASSLDHVKQLIF